MQYPFKNDLLYFKQRIVLASQSPIGYQILIELHTIPVGGHGGDRCTLARITTQFYWKNMKTNVR